MFTFENRLCTYNQIVEYTKKAPSTICWHLKKLKQSRIIICMRYGRSHKYRVTSNEVISRVLYKRKNSSMNSVTYSYSRPQGIWNSI